MFNKIHNPITGKWVNLNTVRGKHILNNYINYTGGGHKYNPRYSSQQTCNLTPWEISIEDRLSKLEHHLYNINTNRSILNRTNYISDDEIDRHMCKTPIFQNRLSRVQIAEKQAAKLHDNQLRKSIIKKGRRGRRPAITGETM